MAYVEPKGTVLQVLESKEVTQLVIAFDRMDSAPIAPAGLYVDPRKGIERFQLHRLVKQEKLVYTFQTYSRSHPLPDVGEVFSYRGWWLPEAMKAAIDTKEQWERKAYPDNGDHDHCLFTWENIAPLAENREGYYSDKYGWITCDAYARFVSGDYYRLRRSNAELLSE